MVFCLSDLTFHQLVSALVCQSMRSEQTTLQKKVREYARDCDRDEARPYARGLAPRIFPEV